MTSKNKLIKELLKAIDAVIDDHHLWDNLYDNSRRSEQAEKSVSQLELVKKLRRQFDQ